MKNLISKNSVHNLKVWKAAEKSKLQTHREGKWAAKTAENGAWSKKPSQNSETFLWMDESIKKKRECKRGYDEKLGENSSSLPTFSPPKQGKKKRFSCFSLLRSERKAVFHSEELGKLRENTFSWKTRISRENSIEEAFPSLNCNIAKSIYVVNLLLLSKWCKLRWNNAQQTVFVS